MPAFQYLPDFLVLLPHLLFYFVLTFNIFLSYQKHSCLHMFFIITLASLPLCSKVHVFIWSNRNNIEINYSYKKTSHVRNSLWINPYCHNTEEGYNAQKCNLPHGSKTHFKKLCILKPVNFRLTWSVMIIIFPYLKLFRDSGSS